MKYILKKVKSDEIREDIIIMCIYMILIHMTECLYDPKVLS